MLKKIKEFLKKDINVNKENISNLILGEVELLDNNNNNLSEELVIETPNLQSHANIINISSEENLNDLMTELKIWRKKFIGRKKELNNRLFKLDKEENELKSLKRNIENQEELNEINERMNSIIMQKVEIIKEKNLIRKIDLDDEFSYNMIGMKINNYKYYLKQQQA